MNAHMRDIMVYSAAMTHTHMFAPKCAFVPRIVCLHVLDAAST